MCQTTVIFSNEAECLAQILIAARESQKLFSGIFAQRQYISDRGLYWMVGQINKSLDCIIILTDNLIQNSKH